MASEKIFALRFDIDTPKCLGEGVPGLIDLAERLGVQFTFFLNVGRAVSLSNFVRMKLNPPPKDKEPEALFFSARKKLGTMGYVYTALVNPQIGPRYPKIVERLAKSQELGLHGGRNHDLWHHRVNEWSHEQTKQELEWSLTWLHKLGVQVRGFSAPGWSARPDLPAILQSLGFDYRADRHGADAVWGIQENKLINVGTNFTGEPGGVAYLEHQRAIGHNDQQLFADFDRRLEFSPDYAVVYDHPYYAGINEIATLEKMLRRMMEQGYKVVTLSEVARRCRLREAM